MTTRLKLMVIGAGGFGQEVIWAAKCFNCIHPMYDIVGYCDDDPTKRGRTVYGYPVLGALEEVDRELSPKPAFVCAVGRNADRKKVVGRALALGWVPVTIIDPTVVVAEGVTVGGGSYVGAGSILSPEARIGSHVIINHACSIGHNSVLEDFVQVSPGGRVSGACRLKEGSMLASNAVLAPGVTLGAFSTLGACSFAMRDIDDHVTAVGNPARIIARRRSGTK